MNKLPGTISIIVGIVLFVIGFLIGRQLPAHHWQPYHGRVLLDTATGHRCDTDKDTSLQSDVPVPNYFDQLDRKGGITPDLPYRTGLPYCGK